MKKAFAIALVSLFVTSAGAMAAPAKSNDNPVVAGAKKVGVAICWPFKKVGEGCKAGWHKVTGK